MTNDEANYERIQKEAAPTEAQLAFLKTLGITHIPLTRGTACAMIQEELKRKAEAKINPTTKQLDLLKQLGIEVIPATKAEAITLIGAALDAQKARKKESQNSLTAISPKWHEID